MKKKLELIGWMIVVNLCWLAVVVITMKLAGH